MTDISELERLEKEATPGPWFFALDQYVSSCRSRIYSADRMVAMCAGDDAFCDANAIFIAAMRNALPALLSRVRELESERDALREALGPFVRANRAIGDEPGPLRLETLRGYRLIDREDFRRAARAYSRSLRQDKGGRNPIETNVERGGT